MPDGTDTNNTEFLNWVMSWEALINGTE